MAWPAAKKACLWVIVGGVLALGAFFLVRFTWEEKPAEQVFEGFRTAIQDDDMHAFSKHAIAICERKLLAGMSEERITEALGSPSSKEWCYADKSGWRAPTGTCWHYGVNDYDSFSQASLYIVTFEDRPIRASFVMGRMGKVLQEAAATFE